MKLPPAALDFLGLRIPRFAPEEVTTRNPDEVPASEVGLAQADVEAVWKSVERYWRLGLHPAISVCIRHRGAVVLDRAIGHARGNGPNDAEDATLVQATPSTPFNFFSGSKALTAMLIHALEERGALHVDEPVATFVPEFARHGKGRITLRDVLTHRAGIPATPSDAIDLDMLEDLDAVLEGICELHPTHAPGTQLAYHAVTGGFVLGEVIRRVTGKDARAFMDEVVCEPLGFDLLNFGVPKERLEEVALDALTGPAPTALMGALLERSLGVPMDRVVELANDPRFRSAIIPAGNVIATANEISRYFELLLRGGELDGVRVFEERTVQRAVAEQIRGEIDRIIMLPIRYGMGFMLGGEVMSFYGPGTPNAFGHLGFTNVLGWADPDRDISVAFMNNGKPLFSVKMLAWVDVMRTINTRFPRTH